MSPTDAECWDLTPLLMYSLAFPPPPAVSAGAGAESAEAGVATAIAAVRVAAPRIAFIVRRNVTGLPSVIIA